MILLIDNYDSFVHNLARYLRRFGHETKVVRNDAVLLEQIAEWQPEAIVVSPGPCTPVLAGCSVPVVREFHQTTPILGVCLGHQVIGQAFGGSVCRAREPVHGRASLVSHVERGVFAGVRNPLRVGRYHSLVVDRESIPACLDVEATLPDGTVMALAHREFPIIGWQFHPESVLTECGYQLLANFLSLAGLKARDGQLGQSELVSKVPTQPDWFQKAIEYPSHRAHVTSPSTD